jgi:hypothetical protein
MTPPRILLKPYSVNGTGIRLLDYREVVPGVYEVTRWLTLFFVPIAPISTWLIRPGTAEGDGLGMEFSFQIVGTRPLRLASVLRKYAMTIVGALPFAVMLKLTSWLRFPKGVEISLVLASIAWFLWILFLGERVGARAYGAPETQPIPSGRDAAA